MTRTSTDRYLRISAASIATIGLLAASACSSSGSKPAAGKTPSTPSTPGSSSSSAPVTTSSSSSSSNNSAGPSELELTSTLINPADIQGDTFTLKSSEPISQSGANGITGLFSNASGSRTLTDILVWFPSTAEADAAISAEVTAAKQQFTGTPTDAALPAGKSGHIYQGSDSKGAVTIMLFEEGQYVVTLEGNSAAGDAVPASVATAVATAQDSKIKAAS